MNERWVFGITLFATIGAGLMAGLFFVFSDFLMRVLDRRPPREAIATMQSINELIVNPLFLLFLVGTALAGLFLAGYSLLSLDGPERTWLVAGGLTYVLGAIILTGAYHIPRNDALDKVDPNSADAAAKWSNYLSEWLPVHHLRTLATVVSMACFVMAIRVG
jgi:uncharacterized membrane protein